MQQQQLHREEEEEITTATAADSMQDHTEVTTDVSAMQDLNEITVERVERIQPRGNGNGNGGQAFLPAFRELINRIEPWRGYMIVFVSMQATIAGTMLLSPSGAYWQDSQGGHQAGDPIMKNMHTESYAHFRALCAMSLNSSLIIFLMLCHEGFCRVPENKFAMLFSSFCGAGCLFGAIVFNTCPGSPDVAAFYLLISAGVMACIFLAAYIPRLTRKFLACMKRRRQAASARRAHNV
ncbi:hypothetical protein ACQ4PT_045264 [Festuca glaucescens]